MRKSMDRTGRGAVSALAALALSAALTSAAAAPAPGDSARVPFAERFHTTGHGGISRAAASWPGCRAAGRRAGAARSGPSRARLRLPAGARVRYARLYWGGGLPAGALGAGGHRTGPDPARVLLAGPGGRYRPVRADGAIGHRTTPRADTYQASADVTALVRQGGPGPYTVARATGARARTASWGGWALVAVYTHPRAPLRRLALWDGFEELGGRRRALTVALNGLRIPPGARGRAGTVTYHGMRDNESGITAKAGRNTPVVLRDSAGPANSPAKSAGPDFGGRTVRAPECRTTGRLDSGLFDLTPALRYGGDRLAFRFTTRKAGYLLGALFVQAGAGH
ncbi:hypothetical protein ADL22_04435 [Streptomyces sp. NRRL F-4489]|uniref:hypothetical protein n=1 Tax=Streptomyces sp. NRRL F-4489 TaxID=1609095 RepID=UPI00074A902D|nr:hypothetical protein [Streptomyces sp. NRRL F-4489]KUL53126.1 hypothetical protein ADL22_04435 [Streptomyces sp. NRRL F-4489]